MANTSTTSHATTNPTAKRRKLSDDNHNSLLPGLPDHIAQICLSLISPTALYSVCRSWRRLIYSAGFPPHRSIYTLSLPTTTVSGSRHDQTLKLKSFDPISSKWITIDSPPLPPYLHRVSFRHPAFISRNLPIQSISVAGNFVLLAGTSVHLLPAFPHPLIFNPLSNKWSSGPPLSTPRRWCAAGALHSTVVVASGIGTHYTDKVSRSVEKWVFQNIESFDYKRKDSYGNWGKFESSDKKQRDSNENWGKIESFDEKRENSNEYREKIESCDKKGENLNGYWENMRSLKNAKICREAIDAIGWKGKLCMVNVKGDYAKEGFVYELDSDEWMDMPAGMLGGWRGPAAAMDEETIYVVDESRGILKRYNDDGDNWLDVMVDERLKGAEYVAAGGGRVCVVCENDGILVVDVVATPPRLWVLETPPGDEILALHILPRMSLS